ncbi:hypothetical protein HDU88_002053 [Geranomyces variabilis]|nr:hypothetical protein HDU88_002053 [Geranomyces variabilis]
MGLTLRLLMELPVADGGRTAIGALGTRRYVPVRQRIYIALVGQVAVGRGRSSRSYCACNSQARERSKGSHGRLAALYSKRASLQGDAVSRCHILGPGLNKTGATLAAQTFSDLTVTNNVSAAPAPTTGDHLVNKTYADGTFATQPTVATLTGRVGTNETNIAGLTTSKQDVVTAGAGLTKTGATLSVNAVQPTVTSLGTLGSLTVSGQIAVGGSSATSPHSFAVNTTAADTVALQGLNAAGITASGTTQLGATVNPTASTGGVLNVGGDIYVDSIGSSAVSAGSGLTKTGSTLSVNAAQPTITSLGTLTGLTVSSTITAATVPAAASDLANKGNVDGLTYLTAGTGISLSGSTLSVNSVQTLSALTVSGAVTVATAPSAATDLTNKAYVDAISYITAGSGITKTGSTLAVAAAQTGITSLGTLSSLMVSGGVTAGGAAATAPHSFAVSSSTADTLLVQGLNAAGYSSLRAHDSTGAYAMSFGYANPSALSFAGMVFLNTTKTFTITAPTITASGALSVTGAISSSSPLTISNSTATTTSNLLNISGNATNYVQFSMSNTSVTNAGFSFAVNGSGSGAAFTGVGGFYVWSNILSNYCFGWKSSGET